MKRREALAALAALGLAPLDAHAQSVGRRFRVGVLLPVAEVAASSLPPIRERLAVQGFVEGRNLALDVRYSRTDPDAARDLIARKADAILAVTTDAAEAALRETKTLPIVFCWVADPPLSGLVKQLGRPGGNVTGLSNRYYELTVKRLELLRDLLPSVKRVAVAGTLANPVHMAALKIARTAAARLGVELLARPDVSWDWDHGLDQAIRAGAQAVCVLSVFGAHGLRYDMENAVRAVARRRIPAVWVERETVEAGGLMAYGTDLHDELRRAVDLIAQILKGRSPDDIPVEQASRFELAVNLKTAKALGLKIPQSILVRADRVIE